jgi:phage protein U
MSAIMSLGMFVFSIPTLAYDQLQRRSDFRHARNARVGARDAAQYLGPGDETIALSGTVYAELTDGEASLDELRAIATAGEANPLICATGKVYGNFVIVGLDERHRDFFPDGTARGIDFALDLLRVDDDATEQAEATTA